MMRVLAYTANFGDYDTPKMHAPQTIAADYLVFNESNCPHLPRHLLGQHPRLLAKFYKLNPYILPAYPHYDFVVWIDGSGTLLRPTSLQTLLSYCRRGYAVFRHPARNNIYEEAEFCKDFPKYLGQPITEQVESYRRQGYPADNGLYACGLIVRETRADFQRVDAEWWQENLHWSYQDQLSFPYVLWSQGRVVDTIGLNQVANDEISFVRDDWTR